MHLIKVSLNSRVYGNCVSSELFIQEKHFKIIFLVCIQLIWSFGINFTFEALDKLKSFGFDRNVETENDGNIEQKRKFIENFDQLQSWAVQMQDANVVNSGVARVIRQQQVWKRNPRRKEVIRILEDQIRNAKVDDHFQVFGVFFFDFVLFASKHLQFFPQSLSQLDNQANVDHEIDHDEYEAIEDVDDCLNCEQDCVQYFGF